MSIINKITIGFVVQAFDTETGKCVEQDFIASTEVSYEDENGDPVSTPTNEIYQPFDMSNIST